MVGAVYLDLLCEYHHARSWLDAEHFGIGIYPDSAVGAFGRFLRWLWRRRWILQRRWRRLRRRWRRPLGFACLMLSICGSGWSGAKGGCCSLRLKAGCLLGSARLRAGCLRGSAADNDDCAADGNGGQIAHRAFRAAEAVLLLDRASAVQLPLAGERLGYNGHL